MYVYVSINRYASIIASLKWSEMVRYACIISCLFEFLSYYVRLTRIMLGICNYKDSFICDEISYPCPYFNDGLVKPSLKRGMAT